MDGVQRAARRAECARHAVEGEGERDDQGDAQRAAGGPDHPVQHLLERVDGRRIGALVAEVIDDVRHQALLADEAEDGDEQEQPGEQGHHRVVGERGRMVGHLPLPVPADHPRHDRPWRRVLRPPAGRARVASAARHIDSSL